MNEPTPELRLGSVLINFFDNRRFVLVDLHEPSRVVTIEDVDVADLIRFLHRWSVKAAAEIELKNRPGGGTPAPV